MKFISLPFQNGEKSRAGLLPFFPNIEFKYSISNCIHSNLTFIYLFYLFFLFFFYKSMVWKILMDGIVSLYVSRTLIER